MNTGPMDPDLLDVLERAAGAWYAVRHGGHVYIWPLRGKHHERARA